MIQLTSTTERPVETWAITTINPVSSPTRPAPAAARHDTEAAGKIEQTISYMMDHLDRPLQVATLAAMASVSPSHYFALFKRRTGSAPMDYFTRLRMEHARRLLDTTSRSVKEVAAALGYEDPFYFSRVFKSVNQVAPSYYRAQQLGRAGSDARAAENPPCESAIRPFRASASAG
jgi:transcriptional regulator GlxA family with amidase domain